MKPQQLERQWHLRIAGLTAFLLLLNYGAAHGAEPSAAVTACGTSISACGCTIVSSGTYTVTAALSTSSTGDCIDIKAKNVILDEHGFSITGPGSGTSTGAGIHVLKSSSGAFLEGGDNEITGWKFGPQVDGKNTISDYTDFDGNAAGIFLNGASGANINDFSARDNTVYGVWIRSGKGNEINCSNTQNNTGTGIYIGCHDDDTRGSTCKGVTSSSGNRIFDHSSRDNGDAGIVIDIGNFGNIVTDFNGSPNSGGTDSIDENPNCGTDQWVDDGSSYTNFGVTNASCIP